MDYQERLDLVISAIAEERERTESSIIDLNFVNNERLKALTREEILETLRNIQLESKAIEPEDKRNYSSIRTITFPSRHPKVPMVERKPPADELQPIRLSILQGFDNWYSVYLFKKSFKLYELTRLNLEKIYNLVLDIDERFQLNPSQMVTIAASSPNYNKFPLLRNKVIGNFKVKLDFRIDALGFLKDKNLIYHYEINDSGDIEIALNVEQFANFKEEIAKIYEEKFKSVAPKSSPKKQDAIAKKGTDENKEILYQITFSYNNEILLNNIALSKVNFDSENHNVFEYLYNNPNRKITKKELKEKIQYSVGKSFHKIVENLGFTGNLRKLFFSVSEQTILFRNPITKEDLEKLGAPQIKLKRNGLE